MTWIKYAGVFVTFLITISTSRAQKDFIGEVSRISYVPDSFFARPYFNTSPFLRRNVLKYRRELRAELTSSLIKQVAFDESGELLPGQKICLPLIGKKTISTTEIVDIPGGVNRFPELNPNLFIVRSIRSIIRGDYMDLLKDKSEKSNVPLPFVQWNLNYSHENDAFVDLGRDFDIKDESFTITALIRLRPGNGTNFKINRGARILSKRSSDNSGWEFVAPSYYGQTISFYANILPGHIDYGKSTLPDNEWIVVGIVVDRNTYSDNIALITPYIDGLPDGPGTYMEITGNLSSNAPLTVGHARDENNNLSTGRRDFRLPGHPRFNPHFQGDIKNIRIWKEALSKQQMRRNAKSLLRSIGHQEITCPVGYQELDCKCYKLFEDLKTFSSAEDFCINEGGHLAMPKTRRVQDFLEILMQQSDKWSFWIGLDDRKEERKKLWSDGTVCDYLNKETFNKFPNGVPDKQYHTEDCVEELKSRLHFSWNDENCIKLNPYICEIRSQKNSCNSRKL